MTRLPGFMSPRAGTQARPSGRLHAVVARNVRRLMVERRLTQRQLAAMANSCLTELSRKLGGIVGWSLLDLERLADALDIEVAVLLREGDDDDRSTYI